METQTIYQTSVEVRAPYHVGIADLDELVGLWTRARSIDEAIDPIMLVTSRTTDRKRLHLSTQIHSSCASWISPTGTCFIWELHTATISGMPTAPRMNRTAACTEIVKRYLEDAGLYILSSAAVARPREMVLLGANCPKFIVFNKKLNCMEPADYAE